MAEIKLADLAKAAAPGYGDDGEKLASAVAESIRGALTGGRQVQIPGLGVLSKPGASGDADFVAGLKLGDPGDSKLKGAVEALVEALKKELLAGRRVLLDGAGAFTVGVAKPEIEQQPRGHRLIKPPGPAIYFESADGRVDFAASDDLRRRLESFKASSILLVVPDRDFFTKTLEYYFESAGWQIEVITKIPDALAKIESGRAYLTIVDCLMPEYQKFCYALKMRRETTNTPLILLHASEEKWKVLPEVTIIGDENLVQPFEFRQLLDLADAEIMRAAEEELIFLQQINLHLPTEEQSVEKVIDTVHKLLEVSGLNEEGQVAMSAAFREAVVNAAQHGNKYKKDRKIEVQYLLDREKITTVVKDQGPGFNHQQFVKSGSTRDAISAARERHAQGRMGGLGIMLMLRCCDRLEYSQSGNQLTLTKFLKPQEA